MRKLFWQINVTLDGFMEGPNHELDYTAQFKDEDFDWYCMDMLKSIDTILLGRVTYQLFADYWPSSTRPDAGRLNELPKVVFSRTLKTVEWNNSRLAGGDVTGEIDHLKRKTGKDIALFGIADLASTLIRLGLIDEYRIFVTPFVLRDGKPMFKNIRDRIALKLLKAQSWSSGMVALYYKPVKA